jgi:DNA polymerase I
VVRTRTAMAEASRIVLDGFEVRTEAKVTRHPERFTDKRGIQMWRVVTQLIEEAGAEEADRQVA